MTIDPIGPFWSSDGQVALLMPALLALVLSALIGIEREVRAKSGQPTDDVAPDEDQPPADEPDPGHHLSGDAGGVDADARHLREITEPVLRHDHEDRRPEPHEGVRAQPGSVASVTLALAGRGDLPGLAAEIAQLSGVRTARTGAEEPLDEQ